MALAPGTQIGPYEIVAPLGAGGMGEVYRARDSRLDRDVALKTLPRAFSDDPERLERFAREARAAGALQHPGVVMVLDVGAHEGVPFIVSELVEGGTLRQALADGPLSPRRAMDLAIQLAEALAAAHARGIIHRDIKPENVATSRDGRVRLLDFGLAKLMSPDPSTSTDTSAKTIEGALLGTAAYMAPEQARGAPADHRADLFALGCVLHEVLTGVSPFHRVSIAETIAALLKEDAPPLPAPVRAAVPGLDVVLHRCLEKTPEARFSSAADLAVALEALVAAADARSGAPADSVPRIAPLEADFRRLTYRRGYVSMARFTPDGHGVVYAANWEGHGFEVYWVFAGSSESRPLGLKGADLLAVSKQSELAISRGRRYQAAFAFTGMLARVPLGGAAPRELLDGVIEADWGPDGQLAIVRDVDGAFVIEYPIGRVVHRAEGGWVSDLRIAPDGRHMAFSDHPRRGDDAGHVCVADFDGGTRALGGSWVSLRGLTWSPDGSEVWFTATRSGASRGLHAVSLDGRLRTMLTIPGSLFITDTAPNGNVLLVHGTYRLGMRAMAPGATEERDLSWMDWSLMRSVSADGRLIVFDETGEGGGPDSGVYVRGTDGSPAVRLGDGIASALSPDGQTVLGIRGRESATLTWMPVGAGVAREVAIDGHELHFAGYFPDGEHVWFSGNPRGGRAVVFRMPTAGGTPEALSESGAGAPILPTPDGRGYCGLAANGVYQIHSLDGAPPRTIQGLRPNDRPMNWATDGRLFVYTRGPIPVPIDLVDIETGTRESWREIMPADRTGFVAIPNIQIAPDVGAYAYSYAAQLSDLYLVQGLS